MSKRKCGCVYADSKNTPAVRHGLEMGGYLKEACPAVIKVLQYLGIQLRAISVK